jgi:ketosteroid isomerase-like protein/catechol 2,3-dioxygenase-like lactoylglutathione lyase family enzyme
MSTDNAALLRNGFQAFLAGDFDALRDLMAPDAQWLWYEPIPGDRHDREKILATLRDRHAEGVVTGLNDILEGGEKLLVEVTGPRLEQRGLPAGRACLVVTMREGRIVRMQDHRNRAEALADAGLAPKPKPAPPAPLEHTEPGWDQVHALIPFVHVADVTASIRFYERLGFRVTGTHPTAAPEPDWASLEAREARLMLARADEPIDAPSQGVLFYVFARDLFGLRDRLIAAGIDAGDIVDGSPGPSVEMRVEDPDGYVLMVAQTDPAAPDRPKAPPCTTR